MIPDNSMLRHYINRHFLTLDKAAPIVINVLEGAIACYDKFNWTSGEYARQKDDAPFDLEPDQMKYADAICSVCALGAIKYAVYSQPKRFKTTGIQTRALELSIAWVRDTLAVSEYFEEPPEDPPLVHTWNDELLENCAYTTHEAKAATVKLFQQAINALRKEPA